MESLEAELRTQLRYELTGIEGVPEVVLDALDTEDASVFENDPMPPEKARAILLAEHQFFGKAIFRLAREIDELRSAGGKGDNLG